MPLFEFKLCNNCQVQIFLKHALMNPRLNPIGMTADYQYRIEFQQGGSPLVLMLVWVHGAPSIYNRTELQIEQLIDNKVGCIVEEDDVSIPS